MTKDSNKNSVIVEKEEEQIMVGESDSIFHIQRVLGEYELTDFWFMNYGAARQ